MSTEKWNLELSEYIKQGEPEKKEKAKTWETAIGLQDVDGLKPSEYLLDTAKEHIEGNINIDEAKKELITIMNNRQKGKKKKTLKKQIKFLYALLKY